MRKTPYSEAIIEAYAASIAAGVLQNLVVEPEHDGEGAETGFYFVSIGEGRRLAQLLRVKRKQIKKTEPIRCVIDTMNDAHDQPGREHHARGDASRRPVRSVPRPSREQGLGVRKKSPPASALSRMWCGSACGAVSSKLMQVYRNGDLSLDPLMAFGITDDHTRQEPQAIALISSNLNSPPPDLQSRASRDNPGILALGS